ncbi:hypothetical protein VTN77DRAFT_4506 [Rasamsonia byssochlamydoides]|uniref:uncharacterized protein n=1 Tax=Rasamsonia byssochlamydoides TaxID=89139 RepID=UPI003743DB44
MAKQDHFSAREVATDDPPPYDQVAVGEFIQGSTNFREDGRIEVDLDSEVCKALSKFIHLPEEIFAPQRPPRYSENKVWDLKLNIVIHIVGSRGDVQPFIALGNELQRHGHRVRLATHNVFEEFVRRSGLEFYPIGGDPAELMAYMVKNPGLIPSMKSLRAGDIRKKRTMIAEMLDGCWKSCIEADPVTNAPFVADAIIANPPSFAHVHCAQALGVPVHLMFTMPWSSTRAFPHPLTNLKDSSTDPKMANYISYGIVEWMTWQGLGDIINKWRRKLDLEPVPETEAPSLVETLKIPFTYCWSPALVPKPTDWPSHIDVCGFFFRDPPKYRPPPDLEVFLSTGPPPVYIGFGSIVIDDPDKMTATLLEAVRMTGVRAIISRGWSNLGGPQLENVFYLGDCPHEWLFQHVVAVVHHGGAGTTACGLLNGKPTVIVPFFGEVAVAGAGPKPIPYKSLNSRNLAEAIRYCLTPEASSAAQHIAAQMRAETGVKAAVESFHANLPLDKLRCDILVDKPAAWAYKKGKKPMKLSKIAVEILMGHLKMDPKKVKLHQANPIVIETRRWDPITGTASAALGTGTDMLKATANMFLKPYDEFKLARAGTARPSSSCSAATPPSTSTSHTNPYSRDDMEVSRSSGKGTTRAIAVASAESFGNFWKAYTKGVMLDVPLAAVEGLRAVPRLYGEEVKDHEKIKDWKSGAVVAAKSFAVGMSEGLTDIFVQPYKGGKEEGVLGVAKGFAKGTIGFTTKTSYAALGLAAYSGQGIYKSVRATVKSKTRHDIVKARHAEGQYLLKNMRNCEVEHAAVIRAFDMLRKGIDEDYV